MNYTIKDKWFDYIKKGNIIDAIQSIESITKNISNREILNELLRISSSYHQNDTSYKIGIISREDYNYQRNRITENLLRLIEDIERYQSNLLRTEQSTSVLSGLDSIVDLAVRLNRNYEKYSLKELKEVLNYIRELSNSYTEIKIKDFTAGSVYVTFEMPYSSFVRLMGNIDNEKIEKLGIAELKLIEFNNVQTKILQRNETPSEFNLTKIKEIIKGRASEGVKYGLIELKKYLSPNSQLFNDFILLNSMFNTNIMTRNLNNSDEFQRTENRVANSLLEIIDRMTEQDIDKNV